MLKLVICLLCGAVLAGAMLQLRHQRRELAYQCSKLHADIEALQIDLWNQQLLIASATGPDAIEQTVGRYNLSLVPNNPNLPSAAGDQSDDAE
jgi:cell division protein FtsL